MTQKKRMIRCILGTVQMGIPYGIANTTGQPDQETANAIVQQALDNGVSFFDTAQAYGVSEEVLGRALQQHNSRPHIITKLPPTLPEDSPALKKSITQSLTRLGVQHLYCLMLHREEHLPLLEHWLGETLQSYAEQGVAEKIGVSVYTPQMALQALAHPLISVMQIPASLFDRRFERAGVFVAAKAAGKELHIRSIFLQGILCMRPAQLPPSLGGLQPALTALCHLAHRASCTPAQLALGWMLRRHPECRCIFGAENPVQVFQNIDYARQASNLPAELLANLDDLLPPQLSELLNPALWQK